MFNYSIETFGCKVNTYDTGLLQKRLSQAEFILNGEEPQIHILNTCAVTAEATKEAVRRIRKIKRSNPRCTVVVTGCAAQVDTDAFADLDEADLIIANSHKGQIEELIKKHLQGLLTEKVFKSNIFKKAELGYGGGVEAGHTRSFLKIQDGCNSFCTFCIIPFARGKSRSLEISQLTDKCNELYDKGVREVVLTGVHIGDYADESLKSANRLEDLVEHLLAYTKIPRFRLTSLEPPELSDRLLELYCDKRLCPHFHMSIQSANTKVLADMKRKYTAEAVEKSLLGINSKLPGAFVGMDVIAGFPGESEQEFQDTFDRLSRLPWTRIHVFPYSPRPGVYANKIQPQIARPEILQRAKQLRELSSERYAQQALQQVGQIKEVMVLGSCKQGQINTLARDYWSLKLEAKELQPGQIVHAKVCGYDHSLQSRMDGQLVGELV